MSAREIACAELNLAEALNLTQMELLNATVRLIDPGETRQKLMARLEQIRNRHGVPMPIDLPAQSDVASAKFLSE